jgi:hypothetical protein
MGVHNVLRLDGQTTSVINKAIVLRPGSNATASLEFDRVIDFPSTSSKFTIRYHAASSLYYTLSTDVIPDAVAQDVVYARNHLVLASSPDLYNWTICDAILADDTGCVCVRACART